jgi:predicted  nucleic acid-binding Zn-ribbon protein
MKDWIENLLALQEVDIRIRQLKQRLELLPNEKRTIEEQQQKDEIELKSSKEKSLKAELDIKQVESEIAKVNEEIQRLQKQSVMVKKNNEYKALMTEIDHCKEKISDFETKEITLLDELEKDKNEYNEIEKNFAAKTRSLKEELAELNEIGQDIGAEIENMKNSRKPLQAKIEPDILNAYNRILAKGRGTPLIKVHDGNCGNCHLKLIPQTLNQTKKAVLTMCENCSHLLYIED